MATKIKFVAGDTVQWSGYLMDATKLTQPGVVVDASDGLVTVTLPDGNATVLDASQARRELKLVK